MKGTPGLFFAGPARPVSRRRNLQRFAEALFPVAPRAALSLVTRLAPRFHPPSPRPLDKQILTPQLIRDILGALPAEDIDAIARRSAAVRYRGRVLRRAVERGGLQAAGQLLRWTPGSRERLLEMKHAERGAFLTTWHAGPTLGIWAGLADAGIPVLKFQVGDRFALPTDWETVDPDQEGDFRAPAMKRALRQLRRGHCVVIPADMYQWSSRFAAAPCLGRKVAFSTAIAALAQLSGVPVLPVFAWWGADGRAIEIDVQPPLDPGPDVDAESPGFETALIGQLARRVEHYLREHPDEYDAHYARMFVRHERIDASPQSGETGCRVPRVS